MEAYRRASISPTPGGVDPSQSPPVAGGEWKGLASAMRVDNAGSGDPAQPQGFQISERLTSPREAAAPQRAGPKAGAEGPGTVEKAGRGGEKNLDAQARVGEQPRMPARPSALVPAAGGGGPGKAAAAPLPPIAPMAEMGLARPMKEPNKLEGATTTTTTTTTLPDIKQGALPPPTAGQMLLKSKQAGNPVFEEMVSRPGPLDPVGLASSLVGGGLGMGSPSPSPSPSPTFGVVGGTGDGSRPGTRERPHNAATRPKTADDLPVVHRDRSDLNPGMTYGGGFQVYASKPAPATLRDLDERGTLPELRFNDTKYMIEGDDGRGLFVGDKAVLAWGEEGVGE